ncbi:hypothetical protein, partial [Pseudomonas sp. SIMBA_044]
TDFFFDGNKYYMLFVRQKRGEGFSGMVAVYENWSIKSLKKKYLFANEPTKFKVTDEGDILVGTIKGLYKISSRQHKIYHFAAKSELSIRDIVRSKDGKFWITTSGKGFYLLENNKLLKMPNDIDNNTSSAHTLLEDQNGFFWIST